jgi:hypothetical protein
MTEAWGPCWVDLNARRRRPRYAYITFGGAVSGLEKGMEVLLYFRLRDGTVAVAVGEVVKVLRSGAVKVRVPHFVGVSAVKWSRADVVGDAIVIRECRIEPAPPPSGAA